jgi:predicted CopG family antitoxin
VVRKMENGAEEIGKNSSDWKNIRIREDTYTRLSALGSMKESFDDVINRLLDFYDFPPSKSVDALRKYAALPENAEYAEAALKLLEAILNLGDDISFTLMIDRHDTSNLPLDEKRKNMAIFRRNKSLFAIVKTARLGQAYIYVPTNYPDAASPYPGCKYVIDVYDKESFERAMNSLQNYYDTMIIE